jgi:5S rRNA maturation endonuclease (ribonuclease M5)
MLKEILSISGKPGLYKMVSQAKNMIIVESLTDGKRIPAYSRDKVISLGDIAIYTMTEDMPLRDVLEKISLKENGNACLVKSDADNNALRKYMEEVLPDYDRDRVYPSDMRKLFSWYNILIQSGITDFSEKEDSRETEESAS